MDLTTDRLTAAVSKITGGVLLSSHYAHPPLQDWAMELANEFANFVRPELELVPIGNPFLRVGREHETEYHWVEMRHRPRSFAYIRFVFKVFTDPSGYEILMQAIDGTRPVHTVLVDWNSPEGIGKFWEAFARLTVFTRMDLWKEAIGGRLPENVTTKERK